MSMGTYYRVLAVQFGPVHTEEILSIPASSYSEALTIAERQDAGHRDRVYGIPVDSYLTARAEGIAFNEADGLLI